MHLGCGFLLISRGGRSGWLCGRPGFLVGSGPMVSPQEKYLRDVLGVRSVVIPEGVELQPTTNAGGSQSFGNPNSMNIALVSAPLTASARELIEKMFLSVGLQDFFALNCSSCSSQQISELLQGRQLLWLFGEQKIKAELPEKTFQLPSLDDLISSKPAQQQKAKRQAWEKIKVLK